MYITKGTAIITQLPSDAASQEAISYAPPGEEQEKLLATAENKVYEVGPRKVRVTPGNSTVSGFVRNAVTGEPVIGSAVFIDSPQIGVTTDVFGFYSLSLNPGKYTIRYTLTANWTSTCWKA